MSLLKNKYVIIREQYQDNIIKLFNKNECLIKILDVQMQDETAAYSIKFVPICGDYNEYIKNVITVDNIKIGLISLSAFSQIENMYNNSLPEARLNETN